MGRQLIAALIGILAAIISGVVVYFITTPAPNLRYTAISSKPFKGATRSVATFAIQLLNGGTKEVEQVTCRLKFPSAKLLDKPSLEGLAAHSATVQPEKSPFGNEVSVSVPFLNPNEPLEVQALLEPSGSDIKPEIEVRAKGVTGVDSSTTERRPPQESALLATAASLFTGLATLLGVAIATKK